MEEALTFRGRRIVGGVRPLVEAAGEKRGSEGASKHTETGSRRASERARERRGELTGGPVSLTSSLSGGRRRGGGGGAEPANRWRTLGAAMAGVDAVRTNSGSRCSGSCWHDWNHQSHRMQLNRRVVLSRWNVEW